MNSAVRLAVLGSGAALLAVGQGHLALGAAAIAGLALVAAAFRAGPPWRLVLPFALLHVGVWEVAYRGMVPLPTFARLGMELGVSSVLAVVLALDAGAVRGRGFGATLVLPSGWAAFDLLSARLSPGGTWGSLAYSFLEPLPLAQLAALTGWTGLTFLAAWIASVLAWAPRVSWQRATAGLAAVAVVALAVLAAGRARMAPALAKDAELTVACAVVPSTYGEDDRTVEDVWAYTRGVDEGPPSRARAEARLAASLDEHAGAARRALEGGAHLVAFPEASATITEKERAPWLQRLGILTREFDAWLAIGWMVFEPGARVPSRNEVVLLGPDGSVARAVLKVTRPPGASHQVADAVAPAETVAGARMATAICFDLDFPHLFEEVGRVGLDVLLAPSNDWAEAAATHARMARLRGIERGCAVVRPTKDGVTLVCDPVGRVLARVDVPEDATTTVLAGVPIDGRTTLYSRTGDLFGLLALMGFVAATALARRRHRGAR